MNSENLNKYVSTGSCPKCGQEGSIRRVTPDEDPKHGILHIKALCDPDTGDGCGHKWIEIYVLTDVDEINWPD